MTPSGVQPLQVQKHVSLKYYYLYFPSYIVMGVGGRACPDAGAGVRAQVDFLLPLCQSMGWNSSHRLGGKHLDS